MPTITTGFAAGGGTGSGTEFQAMQSPLKEALDGYDNTKSYNQQQINVPQLFGDAMSVREEVYAEQGVPLEAEFDEDDSRSWHWVVSASVGSTSAPSPQSMSPTSPGSKAEEERRASATAHRLPVGTIRLVPPPHGPNKYKALPDGDKHHPDSDPPPNLAVHPTEPYVKLGRLAILKPYRKLGLSKLLINTALDYATKNHETICPAPSPTSLEHATRLGKAVEDSMVWRGLVMVHAQVSVAPLWERYGFTEELVNDKGQVEIAKEERWIEEGIEHMAMWRRLKLDTGRHRALSLSLTKGPSKFVN